MYINVRRNIVLCVPAPQEVSGILDIHVLLVCTFREDNSYETGGESQRVLSVAINMLHFLLSRLNSCPDGPISTRAIGREAPSGDSKTAVGQLME